jgi:hypothetical protein
MGRHGESCERGQVAEDRKLKTEVREIASAFVPIMPRGFFRQQDGFPNARVRYCGSKERFVSDGDRDIPSSSSFDASSG